MEGDGATPTIKLVDDLPGERDVQSENVLIDGPMLMDKEGRSYVVNLLGGRLFISNGTKEQVHMPTGSLPRTYEEWLAAIRNWPSLAAWLTPEQKALTDLARQVEDAKHPIAAAVIATKGRPQFLTQWRFPIERVIFPEKRVFSAHSAASSAALLL